MIKEIAAKQIITKTKNVDGWFGIVYNTNFYRGCPHQCIYCDSRSDCYHIENFNDIEVKINAPLLLEKELKSRKIRATIGTGAMSDPYLLVEKQYRITRKCLEVIDKYAFPVCLITKSNLVLDDIDLLASINKKTKATVLFTITTTSDELASILEPGASRPSKRLEAMKLLSERGIYCGVLMMPILPFILDNENNVKKIIEEVKENGGSFIIPYFGVTLRDKQRQHFYAMLDRHFPKVKERYIGTFGDRYECSSPNSQKLYQLFRKECQRSGLLCTMKKIPTWEKEHNTSQLALF